MQTVLPDLGERLALIRLDEFLISVNKLYAPGAHLVIFSDGRIYCDIPGVSDEVVDAYCYLPNNSLSISISEA